ncbi:hypothetical protein B9479_006175 [Cryptococcus floricola]|uniref:Rab-GAP TBC domain-containing protein n=1 Tax=Cryptococcus floricola TaxID=2591691 RepID=A0A5D3ANV0_9TREE|nr:hypothetical protein B9479_006175 [Cryptococcus floricola]
MSPETTQESFEDLSLESPPVSPTPPDDAGDIGAELPVSPTKIPISSSHSDLSFTLSPPPTEEPDALSLAKDASSTSLEHPHPAQYRPELADEDGDIGGGLPSIPPETPPKPKGAHPLSPLSLSSTHHNSDPRLSRVLTRSPSPSYRSFNLSNGHGREDSREDLELPASPTRVPLPGSTSSLSLALSPPRSAPSHTLAFRGYSSSASLEDQTPFQSHPEQLEEGDGDLSAPFESIPLSTTPPAPTAPAAPLPSSPRDKLSPQNTPDKRRSWGGFGISNGERVAHGQLPEHPPLPPPPLEVQRAKSAGDVPQEDGDEPPDSAKTSASTPTPAPRRAAPPPHPFPWPIPTSPPPPNPKRLSAMSTASNATHVSQASTSTSQPQAMPALGVKGSSTFEKVISHTRPAWLPPKDKTEDVGHLHQWEDMMKHAREHEKIVSKQHEKQKLEKEKRLAAEAPKWEKLLDEKDFSAQRVRNDPEMRRLWFEGIPSHLRGRAWSLAVGNPLALSKDVYKPYVSRARKGLANERFPADLLETLERDLDNTLVTLNVFYRGSPLRDDLKELVCAWLVYRSDEGLGYAPYITLIAGILLLASPPATAFHTLLNILAGPVLRAFFTPLPSEIAAYYRVLENLQADRYPKIYANCKSLGVGVPQSWFQSLLVEQLGFEASCRVWDQVFLDGEGYVFRAALAIFGFLEPRLYYPDKGEVLSVLEGHNPASLAIMQRDKERARMRGEVWSEGVDGTLTSFGLNEGQLFAALEEDGWREKDFERLVLREMPDV